MQSRKIIVIGILACAWITLTHGPVATVAGATDRASSPAVVHEETVREIVDPFNGDRWLLLRDSATSGRPGRLVRVPRGSGMDSVLNVRHPDRGGSGTVPAYRPVIHSGDALIVEQSSPVLEARFAAVALETALAGARFRARLQATGAVVRAIAIASGRAALAEEVEGVR
ncbi:MAG: hypothetical protein P4K83_04915 [Terracidiphilus sp.]|nr:hypothetical protein [Terracidiphilus sp.]